MDVVIRIINIIGCIVIGFLIGHFYSRRKKVIRCNDCKHHGGEDCPLFTDAVEFVTDDDWFCADGEEKEGGGS